MITGNYEFSDGLKFEDSSQWDFCTYKDRRFYHEIINDIRNPDIDKYNVKLFKQIPEGAYGKQKNLNEDTGDGFYDPEKGTVFSYEHKFLRIPNEEEVILQI